jgi:hypothetical protein
LSRTRLESERNEAMREAARLAEKLEQANAKATARLAAIAEIAAKLDTGLAFGRDPVELIHAVQGIAKKAMGLTHIPPGTGGDDAP